MSDEQLPWEQTVWAGLEPRECSRDAMRAWVAELLTTDKEQGTEFLNKGGKFCCLGILCEVAIDKGLGIVSDTNGVGVVSYQLVGSGHWEQALPPLEVRAWLMGGRERITISCFISPAAWQWDARLLGGAAAGTLIAEASEDPIGLVAATLLNDTVRMPFALIGDCFEYTYLRDEWAARHAAQG